MHKRDISYFARDGKLWVSGGVLNSPVEVTLDFARKRLPQLKARQEVHEAGELPSDEQLAGFYGRLHQQLEAALREVDGMTASQNSLREKVARLFDEYAAEHVTTWRAEDYAALDGVRDRFTEEVLALPELAVRDALVAIVREVAGWSPTSDDEADLIADCRTALARATAPTPGDEGVGHG